MQLDISKIAASCFEQLTPRLWIKNLENQFASSLLTTCNRLVIVIIKPEQAMWTHTNRKLCNKNLRGVYTKRNLCYCTPCKITKNLFQPYILPNTIAVHNSQFLPSIGKRTKTSNLNLKRGQLFDYTQKVYVLSLPETIKEKSAFRAKTLRREVRNVSLETSKEPSPFGWS